MIDDDTERKEAFDDMMRNLALTSDEIRTLRQYRGVKTHRVVRGLMRKSKKMASKNRKLEKEISYKFTGI